LLEQFNGRIAILSSIVSQTGALPHPNTADAGTGLPPGFEPPKDGSGPTPVTDPANLAQPAKDTVNARVIARDITQRKKMEGAIIHAQKIDSIGNLAGGVAHDFNNILASILGAASIMRRRLTEKAKMYKYVEIIEMAARRGSSLTRQLLTFARKTEPAMK
jgi:signal transduction histidine kinase